MHQRLDTINFSAGPLIILVPQRKRAIPVFLKSTPSSSSSSKEPVGLSPQYEHFLETCSGAMQVYLIKYCSLERLVLYLNAFIPLSTSPDFRRKYSFDNVSYWVLKKKKQDLKKKQNTTMCFYELNFTSAFTNAADMMMS